MGCQRGGVIRASRAFQGKMRSSEKNAGYDCFPLRKVLIIMHLNDLEALFEVRDIPKLSTLL